MKTNALQDEMKDQLKITPHCRTGIHFLLFYSVDTLSRDTVVEFRFTSCVCVCA